MKRPINNVELTFSCHEKWANMSDVGQNKYCEKCRHIVLDFTKLSQEQLNDAARNAPGRLCGRSKSSQMSSRFLKYAAASAMAASILAGTSCAPEEPLPINTDAQLIEQIIEEPELELVGIIFDPDSVAVELDTTLSEEPFYGHQHFDAE